MQPNCARTSKFSAPIVATAAGLIATAVLFAGARTLESAHADDTFRSQADARIAVVKEALLKPVEALTMLNQFFRTLDAVDRQQFHSFAMALLAINPHVRSFSFQRLVSRSERPAYEAAMGELYPGFSIGRWVDGRRVAGGQMDSYRVVDYLEPITGKVTALGLDASTVPNQAGAMQRARDTGLPSASNMLVFGGEPQGQRGFIVMMPVYRRDAPLHDIAARRQAVTGFTTVSVLAASPIERALRDRKLLSDPVIRVSLYEGDSSDDSLLAFRSASDPAVEGRGASRWRWLYSERPKELSQTFSVAGRSWHVSVAALSTGAALHHSGSVIILIAGLGTTFAGAAFLQARARRLSRRRQLDGRNGARMRAACDLLTRDLGLLQQEEQARTLGASAMQAGEHAVIITSASGPDHLIEQVDAAFERMTGYSASEAVGRNGNFLWGDDHDQPSIDDIRASVGRTGPARITLRMYCKDGTLFLCGVHICSVEAAHGEAAYFVVALYDLTAHERYLKELVFQATRDAVTGLANGTLLQDRLMQAIAQANRNGEQLWLLAIDFDRIVPAGGGSAIPPGDMVMAKMGARLQSLVRLTDTVARLGSGEFIVVLAARSDEGLSPQVIRRLLHAVRQPLAVQDHQLLPDCSVGIAVYPEDGEDGAALIANGGDALQDCRDAGDEIRFYSPKPMPGRLAPAYDVV